MDIKNESNLEFQLPKENIIENKKKEELETNLMLDTKQISPFYLYYHIRGKLEIFLMILRTIFTIGVGCKNSLVSILFGDTIKDLIDTSNIDDLSDEEFQILMDVIEPSINKMANKFLIVGAAMLVCYFCMMFFWSYSGLRQMHWMKINYFNIILKQEQGWFNKNNAYEFATKSSSTIRTN